MCERGYIWGCVCFYFTLLMRIGIVYGVDYKRYEGETPLQKVNRDLINNGLHHIKLHVYDLYVCTCVSPVR